MEHALKVGVSGVRGIVGESFTPQVGAAFAQAFGTFLGGGSVVIGRDPRPSGIMVEYAVTAGLRSVGCHPICLGITPTPTLLIATTALGAQGGIAITASHNPSPWNALKFVGGNGRFLNPARVEELTDLYHQGNFPFVPEEELPSLSQHGEAFQTHLQRIQQVVDIQSIRACRFKVAIDCCNGVGALYSPDFLQKTLGCEIVPLFDQATGLFEREPEPRAENLTALCQAVVDHKCDIGFAQDPDGDRLAIVNERGEPIGEDFTLAFAVRQVLEHHCKGPTALNLSTSKCVEQVARDLGSEVIRTPIGEVNVTEAMIEAGAVVGGEGSGGVIVPAIHPCRDSYAAMALTLELMAATRQTVSALRAAMPHFELVRENVPLQPEQAPALLRRLRWHYKNQKIDLRDGVYVDFGDSWIHVRRSNTEPIIRLAAEAPTKKQAQQLMQELRGLVKTGSGNAAEAK